MLPVTPAVRVSMMMPEMTPPGTANEPPMATGDVSVPSNPLPIRFMNLWFPPPPPTKMKSGFDNVLAVRNSVTGLVGTLDAATAPGQRGVTVGDSERRAVVRDANQIRVAAGCR